MFNNTLHVCAEIFTQGTLMCQPVLVLPHLTHIRQVSVRLITIMLCFVWTYNLLLWAFPVLTALQKDCNNYTICTNYIVLLKRPLDCYCCYTLYMHSSKGLSLYYYEHRNQGWMSVCTSAVMAEMQSAITLVCLAVHTMTTNAFGLITLTKVVSGCIFTIAAL